ncbi:MAG: GNAT family N-acetyltransferase [Verrucomicrobiales bacterium]|nr:MAG: GNAT family N-acetyltransferase [Verrucomicrobiales bacterium]
MIQTNSKDNDPSLRLEFCPYDKLFLEESWQWLTDPEIKRLTMTPDFTREDQARWFARLPQMTDYLIWGMKCEGVPVGAMGLKKVTLVDAEYWGYIGDRRYWGVGFGSQIMQFAFEQAGKLMLKSLYLRVHRDNDQAARLYMKSGFKIEREDGDVRIMRRVIVD